MHPVTASVLALSRDIASPPPPCHTNTGHGACMGQCRDGTSNSQGPSRQYACSSPGAQAVCLQQQPPCMWYPAHLSPNVLPAPGATLAPKSLKQQEEADAVYDAKLKAEARVGLKQQ